MSDTPHVTWHDFEAANPDRLITHLDLVPPPFVKHEEAFRQLHYVAKYADDLHCKSIAIENVYIDRDYIEDHSVFYSKNLFPYTNYCKRVHFFIGTKGQIRKALDNILAIGFNKGADAYFEACRDFSDRFYLGFCVIKPLMGSPVGRTVLRSFGKIPKDPKKKLVFKRDYNCLLPYTVHFSGVTLTVKGLAFQQQDVGVSACATTAIWSALQKSSEHENIALATPAGITKLAARFSLPYGRPMPSEGLSLDQMSQAINSLGVAPNLLKVENAEVGKIFLYSAIRSGFPPILVLTDSNRRRHAVAVAGMKIGVAENRGKGETSDTDNFEHVGKRVLGLYIHDDRKGPYLRADFQEVVANTENQSLALTIPGRKTEPYPKEKDDHWKISHILVPMHEKIRLPFSGLSDLARQTADVILRYRVTFKIPRSHIPDGTVQADTRIIRAHKYIESFFSEKSPALIPRIKKLATDTALSRYIGIIRFTTQYADPIDLLVDTTSTKRNIHLIGIIAAGSNSPHTPLLSLWLSTHLNCTLIS